MFLGLLYSNLSEKCIFGNPVVWICKTLSTGKFSKCFHSISQPQKPMYRHQKHDSISIMSKVMLKTAKYG